MLNGAKSKRRTSKPFCKSSRDDSCGTESKKVSAIDHSKNYSVIVMVCICDTCLMKRKQRLSDADVTGDGASSENERDAEAASSEGGTTTNIADQRAVVRKKTKTITGKNMKENFTYEGEEALANMLDVWLLRDYGIFTSAHVYMRHAARKMNGRSSSDGRRLAAKEVVENAKTDVRKEDAPSPDRKRPRKQHRKRDCASGDCARSDEPDNNVAPKEEDRTGGSSHYFWCPFFSCGSRIPKRRTFEHFFKCHMEHIVYHFEIVSDPESGPIFKTTTEDGALSKPTFIHANRCFLFKEKRILTDNLIKHMISKDVEREIAMMNDF